MYVIAFSWSSRTGKSTAIQTLNKIFQQQKKTVKIFPETAQIYIDANPGPITNRYAFEQFIVEEEIKRIAEIQEIKEKNTYDIVLIDRTFLDMFVYIYRCIIHGSITNADLLSHTPEIEVSKTLYDIVVFFDTMIIPDENFSDYNNVDIDWMFKHSLHCIYNEKLVYYTNNIELEKDIDIFIKKYIT